MVAVSGPSHRVLAIGTRLWGRHLRYLQRVEYRVEPRHVEVSRPRFESPVHYWHNHRHDCPSAKALSRFGCGHACCLRGRARRSFGFAEARMEHGGEDCGSVPIGSNRSWRRRACVGVDSG